MRRHGRRGLLISAWTLVWLLNAFILAPAPLFDEMILDLGISHAEAGAIISLFILPMLILQLPGGYLIDRWDNRRIVEASTVVLAAASAVAFLLPSYPVLLASRVVAGTCTAFIFVPCANLVARGGQGDSSKRLALFLSAPAAGVAFGTMVAPAYAHFWGWRAILLGFTLPMVPLLVPFHLSSEARGTAAGLGGFRHFGHALVQRELWLVGATFAASYGAYIFFTSWMPSFLVSQGLVDRFLAGVLVGAGAGMGVLSRPLGGNLALTRWGRRLPILVSFAGLLPLAAYLYLIGGWGATVAVVLGGFLAQFPFSIFYFYARDLLPSELQGTALALMNTTSLFGGFLVPLTVGYIVDATGGFQGAFALLGLMALTGLLLTATLPGSAVAATEGRGAPPPTPWRDTGRRE